MNYSGDERLTGTYLQEFLDTIDRHINYMRADEKKTLDAQAQSGVEGDQFHARYITTCLPRYERLRDRIITITGSANPSLTSAELINAIFNDKGKDLKPGTETANPMMNALVQAGNGKFLPLDAATDELSQSIALGMREQLLASFLELYCIQENKLDDYINQNYLYLEKSDSRFCSGGRINKSVLIAEFQSNFAKSAARRPEDNANSSERSKRYCGKYLDALVQYKKLKEEYPKSNLFVSRQALVDICNCKFKACIANEHPELGEHQRDALCRKRSAAMAKEWGYDLPELESALAR